jgi:hypothetical protein
VIAIGSAIISLGSIVATYFLWRRSGPSIRVTAFVSAADSAVHIEVISAGRMPVTVRRVELRDEWVMKSTTGGEQGSIQPLSRWSIDAAASLSLPVDLPPTNFIQLSVPVSQIVAQVGSQSTEVHVRAWAQRGDGGWNQSARIRVR